MGKEYDNRDIEAQGEHYLRHVSAMTEEGLHSKSDIAAELAHRDIEIERLRANLPEGFPWDAETREDVLDYIGNTLIEARKRKDHNTVLALSRIYDWLDSIEDTDNE